MLLWRSLLAPGLTYSVGAGLERLGVWGLTWEWLYEYAGDAGLAVVVDVVVGQLDERLSSKIPNTVVLRGKAVTLALPL